MSETKPPLPAAFAAVARLYLDRMMAMVADPTHPQHADAVRWCAAHLFPLEHLHDDDDEEG